MTKLYEVTFIAEVYVTIEADNEEEAKEKARTAFRWTDVHLLGADDVTILSDDEEVSD